MPESAEPSCTNNDSDSAYFAETVRMWNQAYSLVAGKTAYTCGCCQKKLVSSDDDVVSDEHMTNAHLTINCNPSSSEHV